MNTQDPMVAIFERNSFYRRQYLLALGAFALSVVVIVLLVSVYIYLRKNPTQPIYFATDGVGRLIEVIPVERPNMTNDDVSAWTIEAVQSALSYDYVNYRRQLQEAEKYFTSYGWRNYMAALKANNNLLALNQRKMVVTARVIEAPKLIAQGILGGAYAWKYEMSLLMTYSLPPFDEKSRFYNPVRATVIVQRQEILKGYKGLGVVQMIANIVTTNGGNQPQEITGTPGESS